MLESVAVEGLDHIVSWQPHGRSFIVHKPKEFTELLPRFFKLSKIPSFQRQLNLYGFVRLTRATDRGAYYHELFLRGKPFLIRHMNRVKVKGTGVRSRSNPDAEPNFWEMSWVGTKGSNNINKEGEEMEDASESSCSSDNDGNIVTSVATTTTTCCSTMRGSSSVVSYEECEDVTSSIDNHQDHEVNNNNYKNQQKVNCEPTSIPFSVPSSQSYLQKPVLFVKEEKDVVLHGWGKPFHYLDSRDIQNIVVAQASNLLHHSSDPEPETEPMDEIHIVDPVDFEGVLDDLFGSNSDILSL